MYGCIDDITERAWTWLVNDRASKECKSVRFRWCYENKGEGDTKSNTQHSTKIKVTHAHGGDVAYPWNSDTPLIRYCSSSLLRAVACFFNSDGLSTHHLTGDHITTLIWMGETNCPKNRRVRIGNQSRPLGSLGTKTKRLIHCLAVKA